MQSLHRAHQVRNGDRKLPGTVHLAQHRRDMARASRCRIGDSGDLVVDLGIVRGVEWIGDELVVSVTPTYSGCPATEVIARDIRSALIDAGVARVRVENRLAPAWTTDWIAADARQRLAEYGIAPPAARAAVSSQAIRIDISGLRRRRIEAAGIPCPRYSTRTRQQSRYGSTPCKRRTAATSAWSLSTISRNLTDPRSCSSSIQGPSPREAGNQRRAPKSDCSAWPFLKLRPADRFRGTIVEPGFTRTL